MSASGKKVTDMAKECNIGPMVQCTRDIGAMTPPAAKAV